MDKNVLLADEILNFPNSSSARDQSRQRIQIIEKGLRKTEDFFNAFFCKVVLFMRGYVPIQPNLRRPFSHGRRNTVLACQLGEPSLKFPGFIHPFCREIQGSAAKNDARFVMALAQVEDSLLEGFGDPRWAIRRRNDGCKLGNRTKRKYWRAVVVEVVWTIPCLKHQVLIACGIEPGNHGLFAVAASKNNEDAGFGLHTAIAREKHCLGLAIRTLEALYVFDHREIPLLRRFDCAPLLMPEQASGRGYV